MNASKIILAALLTFMLFGGPAEAVFVETRLDDPAAESRAVALSQQLRCLVCQNQTISDSNAELARDLRQIVRERILAGDSDQQVLQYMVDRYGDWILMEPPLKASTALLWAAPALFLLGGGIMVLLVARRRARSGTATSPELSDIEQQQLDALLHPESEDKS